MTAFISSVEECDYSLCQGQLSFCSAYSPSSWGGSRSKALNFLSRRQCRYARELPIQVNCCPLGRNAGGGSATAVPLPTVHRSLPSLTPLPTSSPAKLHHQLSQLGTARKLGAVEEPGTSIRTTSRGSVQRTGADSGEEDDDSDGGDEAKYTNPAQLLPAPKVSVDPLDPVQLERWVLDSSGLLKVRPPMPAAESGVNNYYVIPFQVEGPAAWCAVQHGHKQAWMRGLSRRWRCGMLGLQRMGTMTARPLACGLCAGHTWTQSSVAPRACLCSPHEAVNISYNSDLAYSVSMQFLPGSSAVPAFGVP